MTTRVITDAAFAGEDGMLKVWNQATGVVQITDEGHLLDSSTFAWVDDNDTVREMIESGQLVLLEGSAVKSTKKNLKPKSKSSEETETFDATSPMFAEDTALPPAAPAGGSPDEESFILDESKMK